jgi:tetratricopeptide (TPR) repeat protein
MKFWKRTHGLKGLLTRIALFGGALAVVPWNAQAARGTHETEDSNALIMTAEIALQRDDCGRAAANYTIAAQRLTDVKLAARATEVALDCGQFQAAERSAARWRSLAPTEPAALHASMRAALGLYKIDDARGAFEEWVKNGGLANARVAGNDDTGAAGVAEAVRLLAQESGVPATLAMLRGVQARPLQSGPSQLALADLAFDGWNYREALQYGQKALSAGAAVAPTQLLLARAHAGLGEADQAVTAAAAAHNAAPKEQSFASVDVLMLLGREREARTALETLRDVPA